MSTAQFSAVNPPLEISGSSSLIGRYQRPHCRTPSPTAGAGGPAQKGLVGSGAFFPMRDHAGEDNPGREELQ